MEYNIILTIKLTPKIHNNLYKSFDNRCFYEPVILKSFLILVLKFMGVLPAYLSVHHMHAVSTKDNRGT